jgi:hypothetical protein
VRSLIENTGQHAQSYDTSAQTEYHELFPSRFVDQINARNGTGGVEARCDEREQEGGLVGSVSSQLHNGRTIIHDDVDSHKLLKYL